MVSLVDFEFFLNPSRYFGPILCFFMVSPAVMSSVFGGIIFYVLNTSQPDIRLLFNFRLVLSGVATGKQLLLIPTGDLAES